MKLRAATLTAISLLNLWLIGCGGSGYGGGGGGGGSAPAAAPAVSTKAAQNGAVIASLFVTWYVVAGTATMIA